MEGALLTLALLACPVGMGVMMWFMGKNSKRKDQEAGTPPSVEELRAEHERIAAQIDQVEREPSASEGRLASR